MDVATIITNIKSQALVGNTGAADDDARILRYLNKGYFLVFGEIAAINPGLFWKLQTMTITDGTGLFPYSAHIVISVVDTQNNDKLLTRKSISDIECTNAALNDQGSPETYDLVFNGLTTYPLNDTVLQVRYVPPPPPLTADTTEINILVPPLFHEVLEWAALWTMAYDERDKLVGQELQFTKSTYEEHLENLKAYIFSTLPKEKRRVRLSA